MTRAEAKARAKSLGAKVAGSVSKKKYDCPSTRRNSLGVTPKSVMSTRSVGSGSTSTRVCMSV